MGRGKSAEVVDLDSERAQRKAAKVDGAKWPKTIGDCVDMLYKLREGRIDVAKQVDTLKSREELLRQHILDTFKKADIEGARGKLATCSIIPSTVAHIEDYEKFKKWLIKNPDEWDLIQKRINDKAFKDRIENGKRIPGLKRYDFNKLSVTRRGGGSKKTR